MSIGPYTLYEHVGNIAHASSNVMKNYQMFEHKFQNTSSFMGTYIKNKSSKIEFDEGYLNFINSKLYFSNSLGKKGEVDQLTSQLKNSEFTQEYSESLIKIMNFSAKKLGRISQNLTKEYIDIDTSLERLNVAHTDVIRKTNNLYKRMLDNEVELNFSAQRKNRSFHLELPITSKNENNEYIKDISLRRL